MTGGDTYNYTTENVIKWKRIEIRLTQKGSPIFYAYVGAGFKSSIGLAPMQKISV